MPNSNVLKIVSEIMRLTENYCLGERLNRFFERIDRFFRKIGLKNYFVHT